MVRRSIYRNTRSLFNNNDNQIFTRLHINEKNIYDYMYLTNENKQIQEAIKIALHKIVIPFREKKFYNIDTTHYLELVSLFNKTKDVNTCHYLAMESISAAVLGQSLYYESISNIKKLNQQKDLIDILKKDLNDMKNRLKVCMGGEDVYSSIRANTEVTIGIEKPIPVLQFIALRNPFIGWYYYLYGYKEHISPTPEEIITIKNILSSLGTKAVVELDRRIREDFKEDKKYL